MIGYVLKKALGVLARKPIMLWGVSLLSAIVVMLVRSLGAAFPLLTIPLVITIQAGMSALYLDGYNGKEISAKQLFRGFTKECVGRVPAGMCWYQLWVYIWALVPIVNIVKGYSYSFTPYILLSRPDISPMDALKVSMRETYGYKTKLFLADLLIVAIVILAILVLAILAMIPILGVLLFIVGIVSIIIFLPLFVGIVRAGFYQEVQNGNFRQAPSYNYGAYQGYQPPQGGYQAPPQQPGYQPQPQNPPQAPQQPQSSWFCVKCGGENVPAAKFCRKCGQPKQ